MLLFLYAEAAEGETCCSHHMLRVGCSGSTLVKQRAMDYFEMQSILRLNAKGIGYAG